MEDMRSRVAYLQGLVAGMDLNTSTKEGRILNEVIQVLGGVTDELEELKSNQTELESYMETIDEDLYDLEGEIYEDTDELLDDDDFVEVQCPECHDIVYFESDFLDDESLLEVTCPNCETVVFSTDEDFDLSYDSDFQMVADTEDI